MVCMRISTDDENLIDDAIVDVNHDVNIEELSRAISEYIKQIEIVELPQEKENDIKKVMQLHAKAAKEILIVNMWKLDLHGLHAMEAVQALEAHLKMIESQVSTSARQRRRSLLVITGRGNHSRGQPVLPTVIRNFLSENGYDYDDSGPGAITVRPK
ncbi:unnamed protein product [Ilex paraguariensis]